MTKPFSQKWHPFSPVLSLIVLIIAAFAPTVPAAAQGTIEGLVRDASTGESLIGVNVIVVGTSSGAATWPTRSG